LNKQKTILLYDLVSSQLNSRAYVQSLFSTMDDVGLVLDFSKIDFVSRSAIHELIKQQAIASQQGRAINVIRMSTEVKKMYTMVKNSIETPTDKNTKPAEVINTDIKSFLLS